VLVATFPGVAADGERCPLGLAVDPLCIRDSFAYAYLSTETDNRITRFRLEPDEPTSYDEQVVRSGIEKADFHNGGGLVWGSDGGDLELVFCRFWSGWCPAVDGNARSTTRPR